jgi:serine/threonine protein kinase
MAKGAIRIGRYVLLGEIARAGMATVHLGRAIGLGGFSRTVAIKRLHPDLARDPEIVRMLLDEARIAGRISHANVVPVIDVTTERGEMLLVMEYVHGVSLARALSVARAEGHRLSPEIAVGIAVDILSGLHAAHETVDEHGSPLHIVHRDVSPQNVMVGADGVCRLIDFGIAKAALRAESTRGEKVKGKLGYLAPEQLSGGSVDRRVDIFAAAIVIWEMLCGQRLFDFDDIGGALHAVLHAPILSPRSLVPDLPDGVEKAMMRGLDRDPSERFGTAGEFARALEVATPRASPGEIARWLKHVAREPLRERSLLLAREEREGSEAESDAPTSDWTPPRSSGTRTSSPPSRPPEKTPAHRRVVIYEDLNCPFCFGLTETLEREQLLSHTVFRGVEHAPLAPVPWQKPGPNLARMLESEVDAVRRRVPDLAIIFPYGQPNTSYAIHAVARALAEDEAKGTLLRLRIKRALFLEDVDISDPTFVDDLVREVGLKPGPATPRVVNAVARWNRSWQAMKSRMIPTMVAPNGETRLGLGEPDDAVEFVRRHAVP